MRTRLLLGFVVAIAAASLLAAAAPAEEANCRIVRQHNRLELHSPFFVFRLDTADGLRAVSWDNRLTGRSLPLGHGPELEFDVGLPNAPRQSPRLEVANVEAKRQGDAGEVVVQLAAKQPAALATVTYRWDARQPVLRKSVTIGNRSGNAWNRLLNVRLGRYDAGGAKTIDKPAGGTYSVAAPRDFPSATGTHVERGFPAYADDEFFFTLAHPAGAAEGSRGKVSLRQYPGVRLGPHKTFACMEAVYGVAKAGAAPAAFVAHVQSRMRRTIRGHNRPYAIFEPFGARANGDFNETEEFLLDNIAKVAQGQREAGCHFDLYSVDFWVDYRGSLRECDPKRFPRGLQPIRQALDKLGTAMGLWIDGSMEGGTIGGNPRPEVQACLNYDLDKPETLRQAPLGRRSFCRATEPIRSMYTEAFRYHICENGVRLLKFDNTACVCLNPKHEHLPGLYSTEAIEDGLIEFFRALDAESHDVFLMLYWGYKSPWWLLDADTVFDSGIDIEAASPNDQPAPYIRDSVTQTLDQAQWRATENLPPLGKDSLGVWLSNWPWNSQAGKERWQAGFVMDLGRGSLLAQPWSDTPWLSPPERKQMAEFIALLKAQPRCFANSRFILGNPWKNEPYGYCCSDGRRAFLSIYNCCWRDSTLRLELNSAWGLADGKAWDLYRWYPEPARLVGQGPDFRSATSLTLRPFEIVFLEVVPAGQTPSLGRRFESQPIPAAFVEPSRTLLLDVKDVRVAEKPEVEPIWTPLAPDRIASSGGATLRRLPDGSILAGGANPSPDTYTITAQTDLSGITGVRLELLPDASLPCMGPGRAANGNFALDEIRVSASPRKGQSRALPLKLRNPLADFSQISHGGWLIAAALDGDPKTGWSIDPQEGQPHVAVFEVEKPVNFPGGTSLEFVLQQGAPASHNLGRVRLWATTAKPPLPSPKPNGPRQLVVKGSVPASPRGGMLAIAAQLTHDSQPMRIGNPATCLTAQGALGGRKVACTPALGTATYPACWQTWRLVIPAATEPQAFEMTISVTFGPDVQTSFQGHFLPD